MIFYFFILSLSLSQFSSSRNSMMASEHCNDGVIGERQWIINSLASHHFQFIVKSVGWSFFNNTAHPFFTRSMFKCNIIFFLAMDITSLTLASTRASNISLITFTIFFQTHWPFVIATAFVPCRWWCCQIFIIHIWRNISGRLNNLGSKCNWIMGFNLLFSLNNCLCIFWSI